ncbi:cell envelope biogenesis protein TolA [Sphingomonas sp.]|uniref:cell envelope biogenesis protein TolA n=1 Tax=Sphingomonas sp. TaxID=28214 RepID=UPI00345C532E
MSGIAVSPILRPIPRERDDRLWIAIGVSVLAHIALFTILSLLPPSPPPPPVVPMDVTIADDVGLKAGAPNTTVDPAESKAPDIGNPEDSAPPAPAEEKAEPTPPKPQPEAAPPPKPAPVAKPEPKKPAPPAPKPAPKAQPKPAVAAPAKPAVKPGKGTGSTANAIKPKARGLNFGSDYFKGASTKPSPATGTAPKSATMSQQAAMDIGQKIKQQVQPCANRQVNPGPGAERIRVTIRLKINRDGTLASRPVIVGHDGVDDDNRRYQRQVDDRAIATFMGCQPLRGLPPELYDVPNGWSDFSLRYKLPG